MPDTYPLKAERQSVVPALAQRISSIPTIIRERTSGFFTKNEEPPKGKQSILTDFLFKSKNESITPQLISDILLGKCLDKKLLETLEKEARVIYPEAVKYFREKIDKIYSIE